ncbi:MAG: TatD family hydrolase [Bacteroidota bacterium]
MILPNIHSHTVTEPNIKSTILNRLSDFDSIPDTGYYSVGLHPWYLNEQTADKEFDTAIRAALKKNVLAIGECGLDKVCNTDWKLQKKWFEAHISLSIQWGKPMIVHCVKAFWEVRILFKKDWMEEPVIFHGFNRGATLANELISAGYYLSFGKHLMQEQTAAIFAALPLDQVFLETDASELPIESIYQLAAQIKNIPIESLAQQMLINFERVFGIKLEENE